MDTDAGQLSRQNTGQIADDRFADFERAVLQDNIVLCDAKSGVLLAFSGAMVIFCIDALVGVRHARSPLYLVMMPLFLLAGIAFLSACQLSLMTVVPRLRRGREDYVFWESKVFHLSEADYVARMQNLSAEVARREKLTHLHMLAGICRSKFAHFVKAIRLAQLAFVLLVIGELMRLFD